tara:strand:+ start:1976 stop:2185 length:210 start_codon:yes stop_codon:yes gene_type:complete
MRERNKVIPLERINKERARVLEPFQESRITPDPSYFTIESSQDPVKASEGWSDVVYYSGNPVKDSNKTT